MSTFSRFQTRGPGLVEITREVVDWLRPHELRTGLLDSFCRHTSSGLLIQENAARSVRADLEAFFDRLAPEEAGRYRHRAEGDDDMPADIRTVMTGVQLSVPILTAGRPWEPGREPICSSIGARPMRGKSPCI